MRSIDSMPVTAISAKQLVIVKRWTVIFMYFQKGKKKLLYCVEHGYALLPLLVIVLTNIAQFSIILN